MAVVEVPEPEEEGEAALAKMEVANELLAEIQTMKDADTVANIAAAARVYAQRERKGLEAVNLAAGIVLKANARLGVLVREAVASGILNKHGGDRGNQHTGGKQPGRNLGTVEWTPDQKKRWKAKQLAEFLDPDQTGRFERMDEKIDREVASANANGRQLTLSRKRERKPKSAKAVIEIPAMKLPWSVGKEFTADVATLRDAWAQSAPAVIVRAVHACAEAVRASAQATPEAQAADSAAHSS